MVLFQVLFTIDSNGSSFSIYISLSFSSELGWYKTATRKVLLQLFHLISPVIAVIAFTLDPQMFDTFIYRVKIMAYFVFNWIFDI